MPATWDIFERYKQRGLDARKAGQFDSARVYLLEAARTMTELAKQAQTEDLKDARRATAERLLDLARDCADAKPRPQKAARGLATEQSKNEGNADAHDWIVKEKPNINFNDVAGLDEVKEEIRLKMIYPFAHADLAEKFGIKAGGGVLLYGPPGTGKTLLARATAGELDATFFRVSAADVLSKWVGEAEQNVQKLFAAASSEPRAVVFIDEIESLVPARRDDGSSVMQRVVPQILQGMEGFDKNRSNPVLFLGATNVPWQLDSAVLRPGRFDEKVYIPLPDHPARVRLLELYLGKRPLADDVEFNTLANQLEGYSGADIKYICDRSALIPFMQSVAGQRSEEIMLEMIHQAVAEAPKSVTPEMMRRFDEWARQQSMSS